MSETETVILPGGRDARGALDKSDADERSDRIVVACPPHPQHGGNRSDSRLRAVGDALVEQGVDCLRFDYGPWDEGRGERTDARTAIDWAHERYDRVGLFGFSFGGAVALLTAANRDDLRAVSALAPVSRLPADLDAAAAIAEITCPVQIAYGVRDDTADWERVVEYARGQGQTVTELPADHFFVGQQQKVATAVTDFLVSHLGD